MIFTLNSILLSKTLKIALMKIWNNEVFYKLADWLILHLVKFQSHMNPFMIRVIICNVFSWKIVGLANKLDAAMPLWVSSETICLKPSNSNLVLISFFSKTFLLKLLRIMCGCFEAIVWKIVWSNYSVSKSFLLCSSNNFNDGNWNKRKENLQINGNWIRRNSWYVNISILINTAELLHTPWFFKKLLS